MEVVCCIRNLKQRLKCIIDLTLTVFAAQGEHELAGSEDPSILHAYIAYLPSRVAYKEGKLIGLCCILGSNWIGVEFGRRYRYLCLALLKNVFMIAFDLI